MTSSSPRKPPITGWSRRLAALSLALSACVACTGAREPFVTYFNGDHAVSLRHPSSWRTDQAEQEGVWYRYFLAPPSGGQQRTPVSVTLLAGPLSGTLDEYAERYLAGHQLATSASEERQGVAGKSWVFAASNGATRYRLLLFDLEHKVLGLYAQGDAAGFERESAALDELWRSLTFERPERYPRHEWPQQRASLGVPESWRETRTFSGGGTLLAQFVSPALATDKNRSTVHVSLSVTLEGVPDGGGLQEYYQATRQRLGENFQLVSHASFKGGLVDVMRVETPIAISYVKRYYFVDEGRACSLAFEARDDVFPRASRWADFVASTIQLGAVKGAAR